MAGTRGQVYHPYAGGKDRMRELGLFAEFRQRPTGAG
ncbi:hypothetical protein LCGC14_2937130, partial [marine sediment metagenome]